jgi:outer membrane receptor protein involved in Fe transport
MSRAVTWGVLLATAVAVRGVGAQEVGATAPVVTADAGGSGQDEIDVEVPGGEVVVLGNKQGDIERDTTQVVSLLSSEDIARTGEGDIAGALSRVTGISVANGGFVYVRGLGDRYSLALLNGSPLPSPEPLRRTVPLDLFPTDIIASSLVQKTYSANFPGEFGGGVINLTTLAIPKSPFLNLGFGVSGDTETTWQNGYSYFGSSMDWTGYGNRNLPRPLTDFFASGLRVSAGEVDTGEIAKTFVSPDNGLVQRLGQVPANVNGSVTGGNSWMIGDSQIGLVATAGYSNSWRTRDNTEQTPGSLDLSTTNKDYRSVITDNRIVANALLGVGYEFGEGGKLRWTNVYIHDTLKQTSLSEGVWNVTYPGWSFIEQGTAWYERELVSTQLNGGMRFDPVSIDARVAYSHSSRESPYELTVGYARSNNAADPYGAYYINRLSGQNRNFANVAFSDLAEDQVSAGMDLTWRIMPGIVAQAGYDFTDTQRDSTRREFQIRAPSTFPSAVGMFRPDYLIGAAPIDYYGIGLVEPTETDPKFAAELQTNALYAQVQAELFQGLELSLGARYETAKQEVRPVQVFDTPSNSGASTSLDNDYVLPAATLTWRFSEDMQARFSASKTIARPQFRELMFQRYYDPESFREYLGNPLLTDSEFFNLDARYEWYFAREQRFSAGVFYKEIDRPIETYTSYPEGDAPVTSFANAPSARLYGAEIEFQRFLPFQTDSETSFFASRRAIVTGNYTWTQSSLQVGPDDTVEIFGSTTTTRPATEYFVDGSPLTGQSDHLVNLQFGFESLGRMSQQTLLLSWASDRVTSRAGGSSPDIKESPGLRVDFVAREGLHLFDQDMELKLEIRNIFQQGYREFQRLGDNVIYHNKYDIGTSFGLSLNVMF